MGFDNIGNLFPLFPVDLNGVEEQFGFFYSPATGIFVDGLVWKIWVAWQCVMMVSNVSEGCCN